MTAPDPRPGGCLHGPGARLGVCPNCGTVVDEAELARVAGTAGMTCECGHGIDRHEGVGNWGCEAYSPPAIGKSSVCPCTRKPSQIAADAVAAARAEGRAEVEGERDKYRTAWASAAKRAGRAWDLAEAAERRLAEVEGKLRALANGWAAARGPLGVTVNDLVQHDCARDLLAALSDAPEAEGGGSRG